MIVWSQTDDWKKNLINCPALLFTSGPSYRWNLGHNTQIEQAGTKDCTITDKEAANIKIYPDFISEETAIDTKLTKTKRDLMGEFN